MNIFHAMDPSLPGFETLLKALGQASWYGKRQAAVAGVIQRLTADQYLDRLMTLANDTGADSQVRAQAFLFIRNLDQFLASQKRGKTESEWYAFFAQARHKISLMMSHPSQFESGKMPQVPPGSPIGN